MKASKSSSTTTPKPAAAKAKSPSQPKAATGALQVIGDSGQPVDWWFIYKISADSQSPTNQTTKGQEFLYFDSAMAATPGAQPVLSTNKLIDQSGALFDTYSQLFTPAAKANKDLGYFCYNDEDRFQKDPKTGKLSGSGPSTSICGHCKGVLAFDLGSNSAFWLIHSVPLLPMTAEFAYPPTGLEMAQTMLCIQLPNADASKPIADLIYRAHGPNVHVASDLLTVAHNPANNFINPPVTNVPKALGYVPGQAAANNPRINLMQNINNSSGPNPAPYPGHLPFTSKGGQSFLAIAKNRAWGNPKFKQPAKDFYNLLVSTALNENIDVETWERAGSKIPPAQEEGEAHPVEGMHSVNLAPLGIPWSWAEENNHAKLAISDRNNPVGSDHWVCVGDINFTDTMEARGGGTVAFICDPLWQALSSVLSTAAEPNTKASRPAKPKPSPKK